MAQDGLHCTVCGERVPLSMVFDPITCERCMKEIVDARSP